MRMSFFIAMMVFMHPSIYCQKKKESTENCSAAISSISYFWKLDSTATNGFRLCSYKVLIRSKIDSVSRAFLFDKLGTPKFIWHTNKGTEYVYYYFDGKSMPADVRNPIETGYISFNFGEYDKVLKSIDEGVLDR